MSATFFVIDKFYIWCPTDIEMDEPTLVARPPPSKAVVPPSSKAIAAPPPPPISRSRTAPASSMATGVQCHCKISAGESISMKEGANKGRRHWTCGAEGGYGFFEWMDGPSSGTAARDFVTPREVTSRTAPQRSVRDSFFFNAMNVKTQPFSSGQKIPRQSE